MIESVSIDFKKFKNGINCSFILSELNIFKSDYDCFKDDYMFVQLLKKKSCLFYIKINNDEIELIKENQYSNKAIYQKLLFLENDICLQYLNNKIDEKEFKNKLSEYYFEKFQKYIIEIKNYLLEYGHIKTFKTHPRLVYLLTTESLFDILHNIDIENIQCNFTIEDILNNLNIDIVLLLKFKELIDNGYGNLFSFRFNISQFISYEKSGYKITKERRQKFNIIKKELFNSNFLNLLSDNPNNLTLENRSFLNFMFNFIFYGLYFKLFNINELDFLEKNKLLLYLSKHTYSKTDFELFLKKNDIKLKYIFDIDIKFADNFFYPKSFLILNDTIENVIKNHSGDLLAEFLLKYFKYLIQYNKVLFKSDHTNKYLKKENIIITFKDHQKPLYRKFNLTKKEFLNILNKKIVVK